MDRLDTSRVVWAQCTFAPESGDGGAVLVRKAVEAVGECLGVLDREGATAEWFRSPSVGIVQSDFGPLTYVVTMARCRP
jgi:hypothetical protein